jgi:hypothetical protein
MHQSREKSVTSDFTKEQKEYMKLVESQVEVLQQTVDGILANAMHHHDKVCRNPEPGCRDAYVNIFVDHFNALVNSNNVMKSFNPENN